MRFHRIKPSVLLAVVALTGLLFLSRALTPSAFAAPDVTYTWTLENPLPHAEYINGLACPTTGWCKAVGGYGTLLTWNGASWLSDSFVTTRSLTAVACSSTAACKAVGLNGTILSWNGTAWTVDLSGTTLDLYGVSCPSATFCQAVGANGTILGWNGTGWSPRYSGTTQKLLGVSCPTTTTCKAVGAGAHRWKFYRAGGVDQVRLDTGADLWHLDELDPKLWVALSCPVKGLEFDERTLAMLDTDHDGRVRVPEVLGALRWLKANTVKTGDRLRAMVSALGAAPGAAEQPYLERLGYTRPKNLHEKLYARLVTLALRRSGVAG